MDKAFLSELQDRGVPTVVIDYLQAQQVHSLSRFANYIDSRDEIVPLIMDKVGISDRSVKAILTELWREADHTEVLRLQRRASGVGEDDLEDPLPMHVTDSLMQRFEQRYNYRPGLRDLLCEPLLGRLKREIDRKSHTLITIDRVRTAREASRSVSGKRLKVAETLHLEFSASGISKGPRDVDTSWLYVHLLEILLTGHVMTGTFIDAGGKMFATLQTCRDYLSFVKSKALPIVGSAPPLSAVRLADEETRSLWAEQMRSGSSFDEAVLSTEGKMTAFWLFAHRLESAEARQLVENDTQPAPRRPAALPQRNSSAPAAAKRVAELTSSGKEICKLWNLGKCADKCKAGRMHICNFLLKGGKACGATSHRRCDAHPG